jgi:RNA polymerase sigma-70 factor (ECF subfamily)
MVMTFDEQLARSRSGDRAALEELFARWRPLLWLQARRLLGSETCARVDAQDVVQETLAQAFRDLAQFQGQSEGEWVAWLRRLTAGHAAKLRRLHLAGKRDLTREVPFDDTVTRDGNVDPMTEAIRRERAGHLAAAIASLPDAMREVVLRRVFDRQPFQVVARSLDRSPGAARALWTRALRQLREALAKEVSTASSARL